MSERHHAVSEDRTSFTYDIEDVARGWGVASAMNNRLLQLMYIDEGFVHCVTPDQLHGLLAYVDHLHKVAYPTTTPGGDMPPWLHAH